MHSAHSPGYFSTKFPRFPIHIWWSSSWVSEHCSLYHRIFLYIENVLMPVSIHNDINLFQRDVSSFILSFVTLVVFGTNTHTHTAKNTYNLYVYIPFRYKSKETSLLILRQFLRYVAHFLLFFFLYILVIGLWCT